MKKFQDHSPEEAAAMTEGMTTQCQITIKSLTDEEVERGLEALEQARVLRESILKRRKGKPLPSSWRLIRREREKRSKRI